MRTNMIRQLYLSVAALLAMLFAVPALGATCTAQASGNWGSPAVWSACGGGVPGSADTAVIPNSYSVSLSANTTVGAVTINSGGTLTAGAYTFTVNGATTISGALNITSTTGTKTFIGAVTVNSGGWWNNSANEAITFQGGITDNGTFTAGTGVQTFNANAQFIGGSSAITIPSVTVTGVTLTNNGSLTISTALAGTGGFTNAPNATLNIGFTAQVGITTLTASASGNTVSYTYAGAQTIKAVSYYNLTLGGNAGTKSLAGSTVVSGNLTIGSGTTLDIANNANALSVGGNFTNNGALNARSGSVTLNGVAVQTVGGSSTSSFYNLVINNSTSNASGVVLSNSITASNALTLTKGIVATGSNTLTLSATCSASAPSGNSASFVAGLLNLKFNTGTTTCNFPVGDATSLLYAPITVAFTGSGGGTLTGSTTMDTGNSKQTAAGLDPNTSVHRYWTLTKGATAGIATFTNYSITLQFNNPADLGVNANTDIFYARHYTGGAWITPAVGATNSTNTQATGITQTGFGDFVVGIGAASACSPPPGAPAGVTCQCDNFGRSDLNPSTIFGGNWLPNSSSGPAGFPQIAVPGYLRLTDNQGNESNSATLPGIFPAAGNYISVEFKHYAYNGTGADGIGVVLSDYSQPPTPGAFGGSLGFAQKTGINGFNYGWLGVALDEFGNYSNPTEGRIDGPGYYPESIGIRGSGSGTTGYPWVGGALCGATGFPKTGYPNTYVLSAPCASGTTGSLDNSAATSPSRGYAYQIVVDARNYTSSTKSALVSVKRDTSGGTSYTSLIAPFDIYTAQPSQAAVPANWQITFTGSTGGSTNIHEIGALKVCASNILPPTSTSVAGGFNAIDGSITGTDKPSILYGHIFMKIVGVPFKLNIAALASPTSNGLNTVYTSTSGKVELIDDTYDPQTQTSCNASAAACSACSRPVVATQSNFTFASTDKGFKSTVEFKITQPYKRLIARITQTSGGTTTVGCSVDGFSVRPAYYKLAASVPGGKLKAGPVNVTVTPSDAAGAALTGATGSPALSGGALSANPRLSLQSWPAGAMTGTLFFNDVGYFSLATDSVFDPGYGKNSGEANDQTAGDCNPGSGSTPNTCYGYSGNTCTNSAPYSPDSAGKYGCDIGSNPLSSVGRFYPDHYEASVGFAPACSAGAPFTYMDQPFSITDAETPPGRLRVRALAQGKLFNDPDGPLPSYKSGYSHLATVWYGAQNGAGSTADLIGRITPSLSASTAWVNGEYTAPASSFTFKSPATMTPDATWGPYDNLNIGVTVADLAASDRDDSVLTDPTSSAVFFTLNGVTYQAITDPPTKMRLGRMRIDNAYGSEQLPLPVRVLATYWNGNYFATNTLDSCSSTAGFTLPSTSWKGLQSGSTTITKTGTLQNGAGSVTLTKLTQPPTAANGMGSVQLKSNYGWLDGVGQETFGIYRSKFIYLREIY